MRPRVGIAATLACAVLACSLERVARAGEVNADCVHPMAFESARTNFVVMPFGYSPEGFAHDSPLPNTRAFALVQQIHALRALAPFGSVGSVQIGSAVEAPECTPDIVWQKLMGDLPGAMDRVTPGHGLVLMWGVMYATGDEIMMQSSLRFGIRGRDDTLSVKIGGAAFQIEPSAAVLTFPPRSITSEDLAKILSASEDGLSLRDEPREDAPSHRVLPPDGKGPPLGYQVLQVQKDWMQVRFQTLFQTGWLHVSWGSGSEPFADRFPEMHFVRLVTAYLQDRVASDSPGHAPSTALWQAANESWEAFRKQSGDGVDPTVLAVGEQMLGIMRMRRANSADTSGLQQARAHLEAAAALLPVSAIAQSDAAVARLRHEVALRSYPVAPRELEQQFHRSMVLDPGATRSLGNLESFYGYAVRAPVPTGVPESQRLRPDEINAGLQNVTRVRTMSMKHETVPGKHSPAPGPGKGVVTKPKPKPLPKY